MKKLTAILLLLILLFNIAGYRFLFIQLEQNATTRLENKIDAGSYSEDQLVEIRIPLNMPYYSDKDYEAAYGETQWNGQHYRYVKRMIRENVLYLLCIPHDEKNKIVAGKNDFTKALNNGQQNNAPGQQPSFVKLMLSEFTTQEGINVFSVLPLICSKKYLHNTEWLSQFDPLTPSQPPERV